MRRINGPTHGSNSSGNNGDFSVLEVSLLRFKSKRRSVSCARLLLPFGFVVVSARPESSEQRRQLSLLSGSQRCFSNDLGDSRGVRREDAIDQPFAFGGESRVPRPAIGFALAPLHESLRRQLIDEERDPAARDEDPSLNFAEKHGSAMIECFEDAELRWGKPVSRNRLLHTPPDRGARPHENHVELERGRGPSIRSRPLSCSRCT